jgi:hypothetical protein
VELVMPIHDHTKMEPLLEKVRLALSTKNFEIFCGQISDCIKEMREHIFWENQKGVINELQSEYPELEKDLNILHHDHKFLVSSLEEALILARENDPQAFEIFEQFLKLRKKHIDKEDELYISTHTILLKH